MILYQPASLWPGRQHGPFRIRRMRPGHGLNVAGDDGLGPLGTVDRAMLTPGLLVEMHEHVDDEILSYLRKGVMHHRDDTQEEKILTPQHLMLMNAGSGFSHEEEIPPSAQGLTEMLQIFVRPHEAGLPPRLQFHHFEDQDPPTDAWRLIGGPADTEAPMTLRNQVWVRDRLVTAGLDALLPAADDHTIWLHVFSGAGQLGGQPMGPGDSAVVEGEPSLKYLAREGSVLVAFTVDRKAAFTRRGSLSG